MPAYRASSGNGAVGGQRRKIAHHLAQALRAAQAAAGAPGQAAAMFLETSEVLAGDLDLQGDAGVGFAANNVEDILPTRHDAFRQAEADGEIFKVGGGRQHHRVADAVVLEGDRRLLGQVVGPACSFTPYRLSGDWLHAPTSRDTCTAVTLYSGQLVAQSELSVVITLAPDSGKWKVV
jgi:hypothetical protein